MNTAVAKLRIVSLAGPFDRRDAEEITERLLDSGTLYKALEDLLTGDCMPEAFVHRIQMKADDLKRDIDQDRADAFGDDFPEGA